MARLFITLCTVALLTTAAECKDEKKSGCFGTTINFVDTPKEAATKAKQDEKLVFVLHVSGHFEDPRFT
jgi:hypothetical protein